MKNRNNKKERNYGLYRVYETAHFEKRGNMRSPFVNRIKDVDELKEMLKSTVFQIKPCGILLYSKSGIGKSRFMEEFFSKEFLEYEKIKIEVHSKAKVDSLCFVKKLYEAVAAKIERGGKIPFYKKINLKSFQITGNTPLGGGISFGDLFQSNYDAQTLHIFHYLYKNLGHKKYIIDFENFQFIDEDSLDFLIKLFKKNLLNYYIFEFTIPEDGNLLPLMQMKEHLDKYVNCKLFELKQLDLCELEKLCSKLDIQFSIAREVYDSPKYQGNLFAIEMLHGNKSNPDTIEHPKDYVNPICTVLKTLSSDEIFVLYLIILNRDSMRFNELMEVLQIREEGKIKFSSYEVQKMLGTLENLKLIKREHDVIQVYHDTILLELDGWETDVRIFQAYGFLKEYYYSKLVFDNYKERCLLRLVHLYCNFSDEEILTIMPLIKKLIVTQRYPMAIIAEIEKLNQQLIWKSTNRKVIEELSLAIANAAFLVGHWQIALNNLYLIYDKKNFAHRAYLAALISCNVENEKIEETLLQMLQECSENRKLSFSISSSLSAYYMRSRKSQFTKSFIEEILKEYSDFRQTIPYALLLKNQTEFFDNEVALTQLEACFSIFAQSKRFDLICYGKITYASRLAYTGQFKQAEVVLDQLEEIMLKEGIVFRSYYLYNNRAVLKILSGSYSADIEGMLQDALVLVTDQYEKIIILSNLLVYYCLINNQKIALETAIELEKLNFEQYTYEELLHIALYNLYYFYNLNQNSKKASDYRMKLEEMANCQECSSELRDYIYSTLNGDELPPRHQWSAYSSLPYRPDFIGYWQVELTDSY